MTTKPKTRKALAVKAGVIPDPIFAAIAEHKRLAKEFSRRRRNLQTAGAKAEKNLGNAPKTAKTIMMIADAISPLWEQFNDASRVPSARWGCYWPGRSQQRCPAASPWLLMLGATSWKTRRTSFLTGARSHSRRPSTC